MKLVYLLSVISVVVGEIVHLPSFILFVGVTMMAISCIHIVYSSISKKKSKED